MLDLRTPSGWFFLLTGLILVLWSFISPHSRAPLSEVNVNLYCGIFMALFGGVLLALARRAARNAKRLADAGAKNREGSA